MRPVVRLFLPDTLNRVLAEDRKGWLSLPWEAIEDQDSPEETGLRLLWSLGLDAPRLYPIYSTLDGTDWVTAMTGRWTGKLTMSLNGFRFYAPNYLMDGPEGDYNHRLFRNVWEVF